MSLLTKFDQGAVRVGFILDQVCIFLPSPKKMYQIFFSLNF